MRVAAVLLVFVLATLLPHSSAVGETSFGDEFRHTLSSRWIGRDLWDGPFPAHVFMRPGPEQPIPCITIERFEPHNAFYPKPEDYLARFTGPSRARKRGTIRTMDRDADLWEWSYKESARSLDGTGPKTLEIREQFVVIELSDHFLVVKFRSSASRFGHLKEEFQRFLGSLRSKENAR